MMVRKVELLPVLILLMIAAPTFAQQSHNKCGTWRWNIKTITDKTGPQLLSAHPLASSVDKLASEQPKHILSSSSQSDGRLARQQDEERVVEITALVTKVKYEDDNDLHFILKSLNSEQTMIGEIPDPDCKTFDGFPQLRSHFTKTRIDGMGVWDHWKSVKKPVKVRITGVPFWDGSHPKKPKGASPYFREIHPILSIEIL